jgi:hypothetical protein
MVFPVLEKNSAKTKESEQALVGLPRNVCLGIDWHGGALQGGRHHS